MDSVENNATKLNCTLLEEPTKKKSNNNIILITNHNYFGRSTKIAKYLKLTSWT